MIGLRLKKLIKYSNFLILLGALALLLLSNNYNHISTNILSVLPQSQNKTLIKEYEQFNSSKVILLSVKGLNNQALETIKTLEEKLSTLPFIEHKQDLQSQKNHSNKYALYTQKLNTEKLAQLDVKKELQKLHDDLTHSLFPTPINLKDPFNLFEKQPTPTSKVGLKNGHLILKEYGYFSYFQLSSEATTLEAYQQIYTAVHALTQEHKEVTVFSPIFYYVENAHAIKSDVNKIILFASLLLLVLYVVLLKNIRLLLNTLTTLASSAIIAIVVVCSLFEDVSVFVIVFGVSISSVAIDYMFHHYMHGYYKEKKAFNKEVFLGLFTTLIAFIAVSFVSFSLIQQISIFAIVSLICSYVQFAFIYPLIQFKSKKEPTFSFPTFAVPAKYILLFSVGVIVLSLNFIHFDTNLKNLDYNNQPLKKKEHFFTHYLGDEEGMNILIQAKSVDELIANLNSIKPSLTVEHNPLDYLIGWDTFTTQNALLENAHFMQLKSELKTYASALGFRKDFFKNAYVPLSEKPQYTLADLRAQGLDILHFKDNLFLRVTVQKDAYKELSHYAFVKPLSMSLLFEESILKVKEELLNLGKIALLLILTLLLFVTKKRFFISINFLLFPLAMILAYSFFVPFNILHIFMLFIILALCIDYAIYTAKNLDSETKKAIIYSLLSTFAGFGVLIFSQINALQSIGIIASIGIASLALLLIFSKRFTPCN